MALQQALGLSVNPDFGNRSDEQLIQDELDYIKNQSITRLPASLVNQMSDRQMLIDASGKKIQIKYNKGTTTLAFRYKGGICVAVDSRATGGMYIASGTIMKIIKMNKYLVGTIAGGAADCYYWQRVLALRCKMHLLRNRERISVAAASKLLSNMLYGYKGMGLSLGCMIAGYDKNGGDLYYVDNEGARTRGDLFSVGSGSPYAYGAIDSVYRYDMEDEEAFEAARKAIFSATYRDIASGGRVRVVSMKEDGWKFVSDDDCKDLYYRYQDEKNAMK